MIVSLTAFVAIALLTLLFAQTFNKILNYTVFLDCISTAFAAATLFYLRKKAKGNDNDIYKVKPYPIVPILFITVFLFVAASILVADPYTALAGLGIFAAFIVIYFLTKRRGRQSA